MYSNFTNLAAEKLAIGKPGAEVDLTPTPAEYNALHGVAAGVAMANKWLLLGANKDVDILRITTATLAAAGTTQTDAAAVVAYRTFVTASDGAKGVKLPVSMAGDEVTIFNTVQTAGLIVYPATGAAINGLAANAGVVIPQGGCATFRATSATQWYVAAPIVATLNGNWLVATLTTTGATVGIPGVAGFKFVPTSVFVRNNGSAPTTATLICVKEETGGTVLFSWPVAAWAGGNGAVAGIGTASAVLTGLGVPQPTAGKGLVMDATVGNAGATTSMDLVITGYYI
jgi:hypothetical protein